MKRTPFAIYPLMLLLLFSACVATSGVVSTHAIVAPGAATKSYKTFAWYQDEPEAEADYDDGFDADLNRDIRRAVEEELLEKGFTKVSSDPDVLVAYDVSVSVPLEKDKPENFSTGFGYSYGYMSGYRYSYGDGNVPGYRAVDLFKQGTLIVDLVNPNNKQLVWRGWAEGAISKFNSSYSKVHQQVEDVMEAL
ncbi:DUF4136 domain-containing protein [Pontibacter silvestris]|uniref:DUF4136 domain-containing protein n=1 Tax=Pontibacter silvestris TaxID=2305183 RepID=A0ABW4WXX5_9BACT|nr:DUF4136 domain-containing protein [Pontibacter silvestris]MCC9137356.1 DUF4136 domain-containing protein [Pontibacter silvestris]